MESVQLGQPNRPKAAFDVMENTASVDRGQLLIITASRTLPPRLMMNSITDVMTEYI